MQIKKSNKTALLRHLIVFGTFFSEITAFDSFIARNSSFTVPAEMDDSLSL